MNETIMIIFAVLMLAVLALLIFAIILLSRARKEPLSQKDVAFASDVGAVKSILQSMEQNQKMNHLAVQELKDAMKSETKTGEKLQLNIESTMRSIENVRQQYEESKKREVENFQSLKRLESIIAGSKQKGNAGENIVRQALAVLPPDMIVTNYKIKGKDVEFGLALSNKKIMPIDSKWPSSDLLESIAKEQDPEKLDRLSKLVEKEVIKRVSEISQYIDPNLTTPWAIAAIPDSAYALCIDAHRQAYSRNVILVSYSMLLPYILMFFSLHLQHAPSIDLENLANHLIDIKRNVDQMGNILENKIEKAQTMLSNASTEYRQILGTIKGSISTIENQKPNPQGPQEIAISS